MTETYEWKKLNNKRNRNMCCIKSRKRYTDIYLAPRSKDEKNSNKLLIAKVRKWLLTYVKINANIENHLTRSSLLALKLCWPTKSN